MNTTVGILGYQGCIEPHEAIFQSLGVACKRVRSVEDLSSVDRLILPGGESSTMLRFLKLNEMMEPIRAFAATHPVWGICAGAILLAAKVTNPDQDSLQLMDITAHRNFYGPQTDSFSTPVYVDILERRIDAQFIRAPLLAAGAQRSGAAPLVTLARLEDQPIFFAQGHLWACSFHVELGTDPALHEAFVRLETAGKPLSR